MTGGDLDALADHPTLIHPGFPKAASTSIQHNLLQEHGEIHYLGRPYREEGLYEAFNHIHCSDSLSFGMGRCREAVEQAWAPDGMPDRPIAVSDEEFSISRADRALVADRLHELLGPSEILFIVRDQIDALLSLYAHELRMGGKDPGPADDWIQHRWRRYERGMVGEIDGRNYTTTIDAYAERFGRDRIHVLCFEHLKDDPAAFGARICKILDVDPEQGAKLLARPPKNTRQTKGWAVFHRYRHLLPGNDAGFLPRPIRRALRYIVDRTDSIDPEFPPEWERRLEDHFAPSNQRLADEYGIPVEDLGYPH